MRMKNERNCARLSEAKLTKCKKKKKIKFLRHFLAIPIHKQAKTSRKLDSIELENFRYNDFYCYSRWKITKSARKTKGEDSREFVYQFPSMQPLKNEKTPLILTRPRFGTLALRYYFPCAYHGKSSMGSLRPRNNPGHLEKLVTPP